MTTLNAAVSLEQVTNVAVMVGDDLDFDVPRIADITFQVDAPIAKRGLGLRPRLGDGRRQRLFIDGDPHSLAATTGGRLDQDREADRPGNFNRGRIGFDQDHHFPEPPALSAAIAIERAVFLSPSFSIAWGLGPMNSNPLARQTSLK